MRHRRAGAQAAAVVLQHCAASGRAWWVDFLGLGGGLRPVQPGIPCGLAAADRDVGAAVDDSLTYLLGEFSDFQYLGKFSRFLLAQMVFGVEPVEDAISRTGAVMDRWGYRGRDDGRYRLPGVLAQALLINRSAWLADLTTEAFDALRAHAAARSGRHLSALQRVVADLGHCDPPVRPGFNHAPESSAPTPPGPTGLSASGAGLTPPP